MRKFLFGFTYVILSSSAALAIKPCEDFPSCETLGYSQSDTANCTEYLHCIWDPSYKKCVASNDDTCPSGKIPWNECTQKGGIGLVNTNEVVNGVTCVTCQTCDTGYEMIQNPSNKTCLANEYRNFDGNNLHQCCAVQPCPNGKLTDTQCNTKNGVFQYGTTEISNGNTCGKCLSCEDGTKVETNKAGNDDWAQIGVNNDNQNVYCKNNSCCPEGTTYITSVNQISGNGKYCLGSDIELTSNNYQYINMDLAFYPACKSKTLTIATSVKTIVSYVNTTVNNGAIVNELQLHNGGTINAPMPCGTYSTAGSLCKIDGKNCQLKLYGKKRYTFQSNPSATATNLPTIVSCSLEGGKPDTNPELVFESNASSSRYLFSGTDSNKNCTLGTVDNSCSNRTCYWHTSNGELNGVMNNNNTCTSK